MIFSEAVSNAKNSTRIVLLAPPIFADCLLHCLAFHNIEHSFYSGFNQNIISTDFHVFQTENATEFNEIKPNIALVIQSNAEEFHAINFENIINGGVLIYNENIEEKIAATQGFFRKIPFANAEITTDHNQQFLETDFSQIPIQLSDPLLQENIFGLKLLCQQMGIMEEDFYEALMDYDDQEINMFS